MTAVFCLRGPPGPLMSSPVFGLAVQTWPHGDSPTTNLQTAFTVWHESSTLARAKPPLAHLAKEKSGNCLFCVSASGDKTSGAVRRLLRDDL